MLIGQNVLFYRFITTFLPRHHYREGAEFPKEMEFRMKPYNTPKYLLSRFDDALKRKQRNKHVRQIVQPKTHHFLPADFANSAEQ